MRTASEPPPSLKSFAAALPDLWSPRHAPWVRLEFTSPTVSPFCCLRCTDDGEGLNPDLDVPAVLLPSLVVMAEHLVCTATCRTRYHLGQCPGCSTLYWCDG